MAKDQLEPAARSSRGVDLSGKRIGDWTVLHENTHPDDRFRYFLCRCKCGTEHRFHVPYLNTGKLTCCKNCQERKRLQAEAQYVQNFIGTRRGTYTVVDFRGHNKWGSRLWCCRCDCGEETTYTTGQVQSRGNQRMQCAKCYLEGLEFTNRVDNEIPTRFWGRLLHQAKHRNIVVTLTQEEALASFLAQNKHCALSGVPLFFTRLRNNYHRYTNASLDRIDSTKGYSKDNVQWVHKKINMMKGTLAQQNFINWCRQVTALADSEDHLTLPVSR